jgi:integrase
MDMTKLTAISIANMKPGNSRREIPDGKSQGLYLILQPSGHRSWAVRYRAPDTGKPVKLTLGNGGMTLAAARAAAATVWHELSLGRDPAKARDAAKAKAAATKADTLVAVAEEYLKREGPKLRSIGQRRNVFERLIFPVLGNKPIADIKRSDIVRLLDRVEDGSGPRMADVCLATLGRVMVWHSSRDDDFRSPIVRGMGRAKPVAERSRTRILSDGELKCVWAAAADMPVFGQLVQFLVLSGARKSEAANMTSDELSADGVWTLPPERDKAKQGIVRPLSALALAILASVPRINNSQFVFTTRGKRPFRSFHEGKRELDKRSGVGNYVLHDLRRCSRSLMSRAGVDPDVAEMLLGHRVGNTVRQTYDRHSYAAEKKLGYEKLATLVQNIVSPQKNVRPLRA